MKKYFLLFILSLVSMIGLAQDRLISGEIVDRDTKDPAMQVTVQLLKMDSSYVAGTISNENGIFSLTAPENGKYLLRISSIGYTTQVKRIVISEDKNLAMGRMEMGSDAIMLKGATITAQAQKVVLKEDTFVYNSAAYRTPEGSAIEELVKRLPGAEVSDDGTIKINGKEVKKILVDGKEFMTGDTKTALKNLPTSIVDKIKAYDEKSDLSRITGIDDGEEQTVLDFGLKRGMNKGMFSNIDVAAGTENRYSAKGMAALMSDNNRLMLFGNANNVNDMGFGGGRGGRFGAGRQGLNANKMLGINYNYEKKKKLKMDASLRWNHSDGDTYTNSAKQDFVNKDGGAFSNSLKQNYSRSNSWDGRLRLEWQIDSMTNLMFRPSVKWEITDGLSNELSAKYSDDPFAFVTSPLSKTDINKLDSLGKMVNTEDKNGISYNDNNTVQGMLQFNRKLGTNGRNFTLRADASYGKTTAKQLSTDNVYYYLLHKLSGEDSTYQMNRYSFTPTTKYSYSAQATYSEPLWKATFLQLSYKFTYNYNKSDRSTYDFSNLGENYFASINPYYRGWDSYFNLLDNQSVDGYKNNDLSRKSQYKNYIHDINVMLRLIRNKYQLNAGVMVQPQTTKFTQDYLGVSVDTTRSITNFSPTVDFRYRFSKVSNLRFNYRGTSSQPSMSDLLAISDNTDPMNVQVGNPGLKPSFTNNLRLFYNTYIEKHQRAIMTFVNYSNTRNAISNMVYYNSLDGSRINTKINVDGNWNANAGFMFNTAIDSAGVFNVNSFTNLRYENSVAYIQPDKNSSLQQNFTKSATINERLAGSYRNSWLEFELDGSLNYTRARNQLLEKNNLDTWQFAYGGTINISLPWNMSFNTDLHQNSRRGYNDNAMNTNELIWNAQIAQSLLKGNALTLSLQFYDILRQQSNISRTLTAMERSDTEYNSINSYVMLHAIYKLNIFGSKEAREKMMQGPQGRPDFGGRNFREGRNGGNRPPMGGGFGGPR